MDYSCMDTSAACTPVICVFHGCVFLVDIAIPACFPIHQLPTSYSDICVLGKYLVSFIAICFL